jgi:hypothetical protein
VKRTTGKATTGKASGGNDTPAPDPASDNGGGSNAPAPDNGGTGTGTTAEDARAANDKATHQFDDMTDKEYADWLNDRLEGLIGERPFDDDGNLINPPDYA